MVIYSAAAELLYVIIDHHQCSVKMMDGFQTFPSVTLKNIRSMNVSD